MLGRKAGGVRVQQVRRDKVEGSLGRSDIIRCSLDLVLMLHESTDTIRYGRATNVADDLLPEHSCRERDLRSSTTAGRSETSWPRIHVALQEIRCCMLR